MALFRPAFRYCKKIGFFLANPSYCKMWNTQTHNVEALCNEMRQLCSVPYQRGLTFCTGVSLCQAMVLRSDRSVLFLRGGFRFWW